MQVTLSENEFNAIMEKLESIQMDEDGYIPTEAEIDDYIEPHPERYYLYLLWFSEHKPRPKTEEEKKRLKKITTIINHTIKIIPEEGGEAY